MKTAVYLGTRNLYGHMVPAIKSLLCNSDVERIYMGIEDDAFPCELPEICKVINLSGQTFFRKGGPNMKTRFTYMALMRAALHRILPEELHRVLSLDVDTIVDGDISGLWDLPIDDCYFAAVHEWHKAAEGFLYTNCGVCLVNLDRMRDGKGDQVIQALNKIRLEFPEQDAMNMMCQGHIYDIPSEYNANYYTERTDNPRIIHHIGDNSRLPTYADVRKYSSMTFKEIMAKRAGA